MTDMLIGLMNTSPRIQRMFALGLLAIGMLCAIWFSMLIVYQLRDLASEVDEKRFELGKLNGVLARKPANPPSLAVATGATENLYLDGDTMPVTRAKFQERINTIAGQSGAVVVSISGLAESSPDKVPLLGVVADIEGSLSSIHKAMVGIETSRPPLVIRKATIRVVNPVQQGQLQAPLQLATTMEIYGSVNPATGMPPKAPGAK